MKKSYHSIDVPTRVLASTLRSSAGMRPVRSASSLTAVDMRTPLFSRGPGELLNDWSVRKVERIVRPGGDGRGRATSGRSAAPSGAPGRAARCASWDTDLRHTPTTTDRGLLLCVLTSTC